MEGKRLVFHYDKISRNGCKGFIVFVMVWFLAVYRNREGIVTISWGNGRAMLRRHYG